MSLLKISKCATQQLKSILNGHNAIFFGLKSGGCSGFEYIIKPINKLTSKNDEIVIINKIPIHICKKSLMFLIGTEIDWKKSAMGEMFVFKNPVAKNQCGCGISFNPFK